MLTIASLTIFTILVVILFQAGISLYNRFHQHKVAVNNDVSGLVFGAVSLIYSLIIAFSIIAVWNDYEELEATVEKETDKLYKLAFNSSYLSGKIKSDTRREIVAYCNQVLYQEWTNKTGLFIKRQGYFV